MSIYWQIINKTNSIQPATGRYNDPTWKTQIAEECNHRCIYCSIHENQFGGIDNFHVEHYKPKSRFGGLINDIRNLFLACAICNRFKKDDWPNNPDDEFTLPSYPDPSKVDYMILFTVHSNGNLVGNYLTSRYIIERIYLNRPQLILERQEDLIFANFSNSLAAINVHKSQLFKLVEDGDAESLDYLKKMDALSDQITRLLILRRNIVPYEQKDTRKK